MDAGEYSVDAEEPGEYWVDEFENLELSENVGEAAASGADPNGTKKLGDMDA